MPVSSRLHHVLQRAAPQASFWARYVISDCVQKLPTPSAVVLSDSIVFVVRLSHYEETFVSQL